MKPMTYFKLIAISLIVASCSVNTQPDDIKPVDSIVVENVTPVDSLIEEETNEIPEVIETIEGITITHQGYELTIGESSKIEFDTTKSDTTTHLLKLDACVTNRSVSVTSDFEIDLKLTNGDYHTLKSETKDDQFYGYTFLHFDADLNLYVLWENWYEAGHPIMVNAITGEQTEIYGKLFRSNTEHTLTANVGEDIGSGWTKNGLQVFQIVNDTYAQLFEFDPALILNENWGPVNLKWKNDSTILLECVTHDDTGGRLTLYKVIQFKTIIMNC